MGRLIKQGSKGAGVRAIQDVLNFHIRRGTPLKVDGDFGSRTHTRVVEFQRSNQLKPDGIVGSNTLGKLFEEEQLPISFALLPQQASASGIAPPRLIPPLTLPPLTPPLVTTPFLLPPNSSIAVPTLTSSGQAVTFLTTVPVRNDPVDPAARSFSEIMRLLDRLPQSFPFRGAIIGAVPKPVTKIGPLELDPVGPFNFGFDWGVDPVFDVTKIGPPVEFKVGGDVKARYVLKLIDKPGAPVPRLGLFVQGDFRGTIDWTSKAAQSRPEIDFKGSVLTGIGGTF
jgi:peptidoglycan hydrolase-like protein with peptidoglycan-binding domain